MTRSEFEQTARRLRAQMLKVALDFFGSKDDAEDTVQDAMLLLWRYCEQIDSSRNVTGLAVRVTKNCCVSHYRKQRYETECKSQVSNLRPPVTTDTPQEQLEAKDAQQMMTEVMALLKPRERELFEMRRMDGLSTRQIAEQTGIPRSSVSAMVSAARMKMFLELRKRLRL